MAPAKLFRRSVRSAIVTTSVLGALTLGTGAAHAATSHSLVYHWSGSRPVAGEVWFNSGTHRPDLGRNSFTVKDRYCSDGWAIGARYQIGSGSWRWTRLLACYRPAVSAEFHVSVAGDVARQTIRWQGCKVSETSGAYECEAQRTDVVD